VLAFERTLKQHLVSYRIRGEMWRRAVRIGNGRTSSFVRASNVQGDSPGPRVETLNPHATADNPPAHVGLISGHPGELA